MRILLNSTTAPIVCVLAALMVAGPMSVATASELSDVVARIDYGFYTGDARMIDAARSELTRAKSDDGAHAYYTAYAAYRLSRLNVTTRVRERRALIGACLEAGRLSAQSDQWAAEAWILVAACSVQGVAQEPARALGHEARLSEALEAARDLDTDNPRLLLVESWYRQHDVIVEAEQERRRDLLERARAEFDVRASGQGPDWGRAEVLASLGKIYLELGERRDARDFIEQALIEAPEYYFALELRKALSLQR